MTGAWPDHETRQLDERLLAFIETAAAGFDTDVHPAAPASPSQHASGVEDDFTRLALAVFHYQYERVDAYRDWCQALDRTPSRLRDAAAVPALPVEAFRGGRIHSFPAAHEALHFTTSGTSSATTGTLVLDGAALYEASLCRSFEHHVLPDGARLRMLQLIPSRAQAPHSSLAYMIDCVRRRWGSDDSAVFVDGEHLQTAALRTTLEHCAADQEPVLLLGTAIAWLQFLDDCEAQGWQVALPGGSRLFETGGYKGRKRTLSRDALLSRIAHHLGIDPAFVVSEYGMTEMGSQYYTMSLRQSLLGHPVTSEALWSYPAWLQPRVLHSEQDMPAAPREAAEMGLLLHHDLANRGSVAHLMTADMGVPRGDSFLLAGRAPVADLRGCGLAQESLHIGEAP